jgi:hypothetical protein
MVVFYPKICMCAFGNNISRQNSTHMHVESASIIRVEKDMRLSPMK